MNPVIAARVKSSSIVTANSVRSFVTVSSAEDLPELHVAAGVLARADGCVLVAQRDADVHMSGAWEFPGGKIGTRETPLQGLVRELREELDIEVGYARWLMRLSHRYPDRLVHLYIWRVLAWGGEPRGAEGQSLQWLQLAELMDAGLLPADRPIVASLSQDMPVNDCARGNYSVAVA